jgi:hypothetical protein
MTLAALLISLMLLSTCSGPAGFSGGSLYILDVIEKPQEFAGKEITVDGAYLWRPGNPSTAVLAAGVTTLDNGLDAQPLGEQIWIEGFPADVTANLHRPGDSVYGMVRVTGMFTNEGSYGPNGEFKFRMQVSQAEAIEQIQRVEHRIENRGLGEGKVSFFELRQNPQAYNGQTVTTQGYYFWNGAIYVLAEGVTTEEGGTNPQPMENAIWMEGFPPDKSSELNMGPGTPPGYVWGLVEVTGTFQTGGNFGKDGAYQSLFTVTSATPLEQRP